MRIDCWIPKATNTPLEYVTLIFHYHNGCTNTPHVTLYFHYLPYFIQLFNICLSIVRTTVYMKMFYS